MNFRTFIALSLSLLFSPFLTEAKTLTHEKSKMQLTFPDTWKDTADEESLTIMSPNEEVAIVFFLTKATQMDKTLEEVDKQLEAALGEIAWSEDGKATEHPAAGTTPACVEWSGSAKAGAVVVHCLAYDTPSENALGVYYFATKEADTALDGEIQKIFDSIAAVK